MRLTDRMLEGDALFVVFLISAVYGVGIGIATADSFSANTTISWSNFTNGSSDSFNVDNASAITAANLHPIAFSRTGGGTYERRGGLWYRQTDFDAGTYNTTQYSSGVVLQPTISGNPTLVQASNYLNLNGNNNLSYNAVPSNSVTYAIWNISARIGWTLDFDFVWNATTAGGGGAVWVGLGTVGGTVQTNPGNFVGIALRDEGAEAPTLRASQWLNSVHSTGNNVNLNLNQHYWLTVTLSGGTSLSAAVYSDAARTVQVGINLTLVVTGASFTEAYAVNNNPEYAGATVTGYVGNHSLNGSSLWSASALPPSGNWTSAWSDTGRAATFSQLRWNSTATQGHIDLNARVGDTLPGLAASPWTLVTRFDNGTAACPCSSGSNLSNLTGRYVQFQANFTSDDPNGVSPNLADAQLFSTLDDVGTFLLNGNSYQILVGQTESLVPAQFLDGLNTVNLSALDNLSYLNLNLTYNYGNGLVILSNLKTCYAWKNTTAHAEVSNAILTFTKPAGSWTGGWNSSAYLNGTLQTSNQTNATNFNYSAYEDSTTVYVNISTLNNTSTWNVLADFVCLNATASDEVSGASLSSFAVQEIGGVSTKNTGVGYIWFNGTEVINGGGTAATYRVSATGYDARDFLLTLPASPINQSFSLLNSTSGAYIVFTVTDQNGVPVIGATVTGVNVVSGLTVCSGLTDSSGSVRCFLNPATTYQFTFTASGFSTFVATIQPTKTLYNIRLGGTDQRLNNTFGEFSVLYLPITDAINRSNPVWITLRAWSSICRLINMSLNASYGGAYYTNNSTASCSDSINITLNTAQASGGAFVGTNATVWYYDNTGAIQRWTKARTLAVYLLGRGTEANLFKVIAGGSPGLATAFPGFGANFIALVTSLLLVLIVARLAPIGGSGAGVLFLMILSFFLVGGLASVNTLAMAAMSTTGAIMLRRTSL